MREPPWPRPTSPSRRGPLTANPSLLAGPYPTGAAGPAQGRGPIRRRGHAPAPAGHPRGPGGGPRRPALPYRGCRRPLPRARCRPSLPAAASAPARGLAPTPAAAAGASERAERGPPPRPASPPSSSRLASSTVPAAPLRRRAVWLGAGSACLPTIKEEEVEVLLAVLVLAQLLSSPPCPLPASGPPRRSGGPRGRPALGPCAASAARRRPGVHTPGSPRRPRRHRGAAPGSAREAKDPRCSRDAARRPGGLFICCIPAQQLQRCSTQCTRPRMTPRVRACTAACCWG